MKVNAKLAKALGAAHGVVATRTFLIWVYVFATAAGVTWGWMLAHVAFKPPTAPGQVYIAVFDRNPQAVVSLSVSVNPVDPAADTVTVRDVSGKPGTLIAVTECASVPGSRQPSTPVTLTSYGVPAQAPPEVRARVVTAFGRPFPLGCFQHGASGTYTIENVTLPALGTDNAIAASATGLPQVYASMPAPAAVNALIQVFPGAQCPPVLAAAGSTLSPSSSPSASPSPSPSPAPPARPACFLATTADGTAGPAPARGFQHFAVPRTLDTSESVEPVSLGSDLLQSEYPAASTTSSAIAWTGVGILSPSLHVADPSSDLKLSKDSFFSGILFGIAAATALALLDQLVKAREEASRTPRTPSAPRTPAD